MARTRKAGKAGLRAFVNRVNSDALLRMRFLVNPVQTLDEAGIHLSDELKSQLQAVVHEYVEKYPNIALLPTGISQGSKKKYGVAITAGTEGYEGNRGCEKMLFI